MLLHPDSAIPDGHERDAEEKAKDAAHLSNHGGGRVKKLLSLNQSVPATILSFNIGEPSSWALKSLTFPVGTL